MNVIEMHILVNTGSQKLNSDETGRPKTGILAGVPRGRVSSQCWKRAIRSMFNQLIGADAVQGVRTREISQYLQKHLLTVDRDEEEAIAVTIPFVDQVVGAMKTPKTKNGEACSETVAFVGYDELERMTDFVTRKFDDILLLHRSIEEAPKDKRDEAKKALKALFKTFSLGTQAADIALFGRMLAEHPRFSIEASCQVAHALSTNALVEEFDSFTAMDELRDREDHHGAGFMGTHGFTSNCYYRYLALDLDTLKSNLDDDEPLFRKAVRAFLEAVIKAMPSGQGNAFATPVRPSTVFIVGRNNGERASLINAFAAPAHKTHKKDLIQNSAEALDKAWAAEVAGFGTDGITGQVLFDQSGADFQHLNGESDGFRRDSIKEVIDVTMNWLTTEEK